MFSIESARRFRLNSAVLLPLVRMYFGWVVWLGFDSARRLVVGFSSLPPPFWHILC